MKRIAIAIAALALAGPAFAQDDGDDDYSWQQVPQDVPQPPARGPTFDDFQNDGELSGNGQWVDTPEYGTVWQPTSVDSDWRPYLYGHWAWTEAGWAWGSGEPFGWAGDPYGPWGCSPGTGGDWHPGRVWGPRRQAPVARPRTQPYFGGVPGPAYGGTPRPQAQPPAQQFTPRVSPSPRPAPTAQPQASQPHATAPVKSEPHVKEK